MKTRLRNWQHRSVARPSHRGFVPSRSSQSARWRTGSQAHIDGTPSAPFPEQPRVQDEHVRSMFANPREALQAVGRRDNVELLVLHEMQSGTFLPLSCNRPSLQCVYHAPPAGCLESQDVCESAVPPDSGRRSQKIVIMLPSPTAERAFHGQRIFFHIRAGG